jgi:hypothetical protein
MYAYALLHCLLGIRGGAKVTIEIVEFLSRGRVISNASDRLDLGLSGRKPDTVKLTRFPSVRSIDHNVLRVYCIAPSSLVVFVVYFQVYILIRL